MSAPDWDAATENRYEQRPRYCGCCAADLHPFECGGRCVHCRRQHTPDHDPATCELCDPDYDMQPNPFLTERLEREARAHA